mmetsp:Transcript_13772/g.32397  ORF Transcript_13772/g.32397 Transcript_13772/m.32397 type:complete len:209 (+) Transcript_13772:586-1212(+)
MCKSDSGLHESARTRGVRNGEDPLAPFPADGSGEGSLRTEAMLSLSLPSAPSLAEPAGLSSPSLLPAAAGAAAPSHSAGGSPEGEGGASPSLSCSWSSCCPNTAGGTGGAKGTSVMLSASLSSSWPPLLWSPTGSTSSLSILSYPSDSSGEGSSTTSGALAPWQLDAGSSPLVVVPVDSSSSQHDADSSLLMASPSAFGLARSKLDSA